MVRRRGWMDDWRLRRGGIQIVLVEKFTLLALFA